MVPFQMCKLQWTPKRYFYFGGKRLYLSGKNLCTISQILEARDSYMDGKLDIT